MIVSIVFSSYNRILSKIIENPKKYPVKRVPRSHDTECGFSISLMQSSCSQTKVRWLIVNPSTRLCFCWQHYREFVSARRITQEREKVLL